MPRLYVLSGDDLGVVREFESGAVIGRAPQVDLKIRGASISRQHARLEQRGGEWFVVDLGSSNGTFVDSRRYAPWLHRLLLGVSGLAVAGLPDRHQIVYLRYLAEAQGYQPRHNCGGQAGGDGET